MCFLALELSMGMACHPWDLQLWLLISGQSTTSEVSAWGGQVPQVLYTETLMSVVKMGSEMGRVSY